MKYPEQYCGPFLPCLFNAKILTQATLNAFRE